jgi:hypothetical protein
VYWLPWHFYTNYKRKGKTVVSLDPSKPQPAEPLLTRAGIVGGVTAAIDLFVAFGIHLSTAQDVAILGVTNAVVVPLAIGLWARRSVFSPATVARMLGAKAVASPPPVPPAS